MVGEVTTIESGRAVYISSLYSQKDPEIRKCIGREVWLCSGQSNMEFMLRQSTTGEKDIPCAADEQLRLYDMKARWRTDAVQWDVSVLDSLNHLQYYKDTRWEVCSPLQCRLFLGDSLLFRSDIAG